MAESASKPGAVRRTAKTAAENSTTGKPMAAKAARKPKAARPVAAKAAPTSKQPAAPRTGKKGPAKAGTKPDVAIPYSQVAQLAYRYWQERGCKHGHDHEDWERAERELRQDVARRLERAS